MSHDKSNLGSALEAQQHAARLSAISKPQQKTSEIRSKRSSRLAFNASSQDQHVSFRQSSQKSGPRLMMTELQRLEPTNHAAIVTISRQHLSQNSIDPSP